MVESPITRRKAEDDIMSASEPTCLHDWRTANLITIAAKQRQAATHPPEAMCEAHDILNQMQLSDVAEKCSRVLWMVM
jgi:pyruvate-formate lyase